MPRETPAQRRTRLAIASGLTASSREFGIMCREKPQRVGIVAEGDSWFAYPRKWLAFGADINIVHHIADRLQGSDRANLLRLACNGDEAVEMTSGAQFQRLYRILQNNHHRVQLLLFSGGGNDIVGKHDMLPLLNDYQPGMTALDCIEKQRFERKLDSVVLAYQRLIDLCADIVPDVTIITHTYDIPRPQDRGAEFFWGLIKTRPWIYPYLTRRQIPEALHLPIIEHMLGTFGARLKALAAVPEAARRLKVVDTQGTLRPGHGRDWLNEIHPTEYGFRRVTRKIYRAMRSAAPDLPAW